MKISLALGGTSWRGVGVGVGVEEEEGGAGVPSILSDVSVCKRLRVR